MGCLSQDLGKIVITLCGFAILLQILYTVRVMDISSYTYNTWRVYYYLRHLKNFTDQHELPVCDTNFSQPSLNTSLNTTEKFEPEVDPKPTAVLEQTYSTVQSGSWFPQTCESNHSVAVIVPYRDRETHLHIFLWNIHKFMQKQLLNYQIFIVEQVELQKFNRAKLMNVGFVEALKLRQDFGCFVFHDVDLIPLDYRIWYGCSETGPLHLAVAMDKFKYRMPYSTFFGGVSAFTKRQFKKMNGFTNEYFGWGGEDDEAWNRVMHSGQTIVRLPKTVAKYKMIRHGIDKLNEPNPRRREQLALSRITWKTDGLNTLAYQLIRTNFTKLYVRMLVDLLPSYNTTQNNVTVVV